MQEQWDRTLLPLRDKEPYVPVAIGRVSSTIGPPEPHLLRRYPAIADLERRAERRIPKRLSGYVFGGADSGAGMRENRLAFERIQLVPRYGSDVMQRSTNVEFFGRSWGAPIGVSPVGLLGSIWPGAEHALAAAARAARVPFVLSTFSAHALETIAPIAGPSAWFQLYAIGTMDITLDVVRRAQAADFKALVVTLDAPVNAKRPRDIRNGFEFPPRLTPSFLAEIARCPAWATAAWHEGYPAHRSLLPYVPPGQSQAADLAYMQEKLSIFSLTWEQISEIRQLWQGPLIIKGLQHPDDALTAVARGADGLIVSNHGGRQLDAAPASIDSLPAIAAKTGRQTVLMLDSGVRSGLDVAKTLVRGGQMAFSGRSFIAGCAALGANCGARYTMALLAHEVSLALAQLGVQAPKDLSAAFETRDSRR
jgi:(S)-mandelate dehydrogenase